LSVGGLADQTQSHPWTVSEGLNDVPGVAEFEVPSAGGTSRSESAPREAIRAMSTAPTVAEIVSQVDVASYTSIHQDMLYTHLGDNRGAGGGPDHDPARDNILTYFENLGLDASLDPFVHQGYEGENVVGVKTSSVHPDDVYIVGAHYDSVNNPGADDNASGVAAVMEAARVMSPYEFDSTLAFIAFDQEETGLHGSYAYVEEHLSDNILGMVSLDMVAYNPAGGNENMVRLYDAVSGGVIKADLADAFTLYGGGITTLDSGQIGASDHAPFEYAGFDAALVIEHEVWTNPHYHQPTDAIETPDYIDYDFAINVTAASVGYLATAAGISSGGVRGSKFHDLDADGVWDQPEEPGLEGWHIYVDADEDGQFDPGEPDAWTDVNGAYAITGLAPGTHTVAEEVRPGWHGTSPSSFDGELEFEQVLTDDQGGVDGLDNPYSVTVSPDGNHVYAASYADDALAVFSRDPVTGELTFVEVVKDGEGGVDGLNGARSVTVSPDGNHVYAAGYVDDALAVFSRDPLTGRLSFVEAAKNGEGGVQGLNGARFVTVSPDGSHVYTAAYLDFGVVVFERDPATGELSFVQHFTSPSGLDDPTSVAVAPDGNSVYATGMAVDAVVVFRRHPVTGELTDVQIVKDGEGGVNGLNGATSVTLGPDGRHVYVAGALDDAVAVFARDPLTGELSFLQMLRDGQGGVDGLDFAQSVTISSDGGNAYVAARNDDAVAVFSRNPATGELSFVEVLRDGQGGVEGLDYATCVTVSPDGGHVYATGRDDDALAVFSRTARVPASHALVVGPGQTVENVDFGNRADLDFGDAPNGPYPTLIGSNGARHVVVGPFLGGPADAEPDGQPHAGALGDDLAYGSDDEDGVQIPLLVPGQQAMIQVEVNGGGGFLDAWIDFNADGDWTDSGEQVHNLHLPDGIHQIPVAVPADAVPALSFARFRISSQGGLSPVGRADDGEVEDYEVEIYGPGTIEGSMWNDLDGDGSWDQPDEPALQGWHVYLDENGDHGFTPGEPEVWTAADGRYSFPDLTSGTYRVAEEVQPGWRQSFPGTVDFRLLAATGSSGFHPISLVELQTDPVADVLIGRSSSNLGLDVDPTTGVLYGASSSLRTVDTCDGSYVTIGSIDSATETGILMRSIAFAPDGALYGISMIPRKLYTIDKATAFATEIGTIDVYTWGIDFAPDGTLYSASTSLIVLDPATGAVVQTIGSLGGPRVMDIDFAPDGYLYGVYDDDSNLYRIDPVNASTTLIGTYLSETNCVASEMIPARPGTYTVTITPGQTVGGRDFGNQAFDFGDAPDPTYPTLSANNGARHVIGGPFMGAAVDAEPDGQPTPVADGDDLGGSDDEDGVTIHPIVARGDAVLVDVDMTASPVGGLLNGWVDLNADGDWADPGEQVFIDVPLTAGIVNPLSFAVPLTATPGQTYARFRVDSTGGLSYDGPAADGEVEDYTLEIPERVHIYGTAGDDTIEFDTNGTTHTVKVNTTTYTITDSSDVYIYALDGDDSLRIDDLSAAAEKVYLDEGATTRCGSTISARPPKRSIWTRARSTSTGCLPTRSTPTASRRSVCTAAAQTTRPTSPGRPR